MKKTIAILLVAVLAVSSVFAGFTLSGEANVSLKGDFDAKTLGFKNGDNKVKVAIEGATAEKVNEGDIYAGVKAVLELKLDKAVTSAKTDDAGKLVVETADFIKVKELKIKEAYITDGNWKLSILSAAATPTFAKGWETVKNADDETKDVTLKPAVDKDIPGVTLEVAGWKAGVGLNADFNKNGAKNVMATVATPVFTFDAVSVKAGAGVANIAGKYSVVGGAEAKYATDGVSATVAADAVYKEGADFEAAVRANVAVAPVTVDAFFATETDLMTKVNTYVDRGYVFTIKYDGQTLPVKNSVKENYLSAKVVADLNSFDVPVTITAAGLDLINDKYFDVEAKASISGVNGTLFGGYEFDNEVYHVGVAADYTVETVGKLYGQATLFGKSSNVFTTLKLGVENTTLVSGATLKLEYSDALISNADGFKNKAGAVTASAQIKF